MSQTLDNGCWTCGSYGDGKCLCGETRVCEYCTKSIVGEHYLWHWKNCRTTAAKKCAEAKIVEILHEADTPLDSTTIVKRIQQDPSNFAYGEDIRHAIWALKSMGVVDFTHDWKIELVEQ